MISVSLAEGPISRIFTRKMCLTFESRPGWNHTFRYPAALLEELKFWYSNIDSFNGYSLRLYQLRLLSSSHLHELKAIYYELLSFADRLTHKRVTFSPIDRVLPE